MNNPEKEILLSCQGIHHWFGPKRVLHDVNLDIIRGEIVALVGPSGCGKSTLLRAIVGTHPPCEGNICMLRNGTIDCTVRAPGRDRGIVYQQYSLFPFMTAQENVAFGLMLDQSSILSRLFNWFKWRALRKTHMEEAAALLEKLHLKEAIRQYPHQMSGGMRQRVAIAQAVIMKPEILLLDEPFGALDEATREELQRMLLTFYAENCQAKAQGELPPYTILIVTHELNEAIYVSDRVAALSQYWGWQKDGHATCPGATIVYDKLAPVFLPDEERNFEVFAKQREEIRAAAFSPHILQEREAFHQFWTSVHNGDGKGVLA